MKILPDLTTRHKPQHTGVRIELDRRVEPAPRSRFTLGEHFVPRLKAVHFGTPFLPENVIPGVSRGTERMCKARPDIRNERERLDGVGFSKPTAQRRGGKRPKRFYRPKDGHQNGPMFGFYCAATGARLASCRGVIHHVMGEAQKFAEAQGLTLQDIHVRLEDHDA
jgi:hypothetical protein